MKTLELLSGRTRRKTFLLFTVAALSAYLLISLCERLVVLYLYPSSTETSSAAALDIVLVILQISSVLLLIGFAVANIVLSVRRLHDIGYSGYWAIGIVALQALSGVGTIFGAVLVLSELALIIMPGEPGDNRFGTDPRHEKIALAFRD